MEKFEFFSKKSEREREREKERKAPDFGLFFRVRHSECLSTPVSPLSFQLYKSSVSNSVPPARWALSFDEAIFSRQKTTTTKRIEIFIHCRHAKGEEGGANRKSNTRPTTPD